MDTPHFYDTSVFNACEQTGCMMETLDIWKDVPPSLVTIPVEWEYTMPYGIVYAKNPSHATQNFIQTIQGYADSKKGERHEKAFSFFARSVLNPCLPEDWKPYGFNGP